MGGVQPETLARVFEGVQYLTTVTDGPLPSWRPVATDAQVTLIQLANDDAVAVSIRLTGVCKLRKGPLASRALLQSPFAYRLDVFRLLMTRCFQIEQTGAGRNMWSGRTTMLRHFAVSALAW